MDHGAPSMCHRPTAHLQAIPGQAVLACCQRMVLEFPGAHAVCVHTNPLSPHLPAALRLLGTNRWHDDYTAFKAGVHDLEVMLENVMQLALDSSPSLASMLELLEGFQLVAKRAAVRRAVERHTSGFYTKFMAEINAVKKHFDALRRSPPVSPMLPQYAGAARCGHSLRSDVGSRVHLLCSTECRPIAH